MTNQRALTHVVAHVRHSNLTHADPGRVEAFGAS